MADAPTAAEQLRAYEDEVLGADTPRINGQIERGIGSHYSRLTPDQHKRHHALEHLVSTEEHLDHARGALAAAEVAHKDALDAVAKTAEKPDDTSKVAKRSVSRGG